MITGAAIGLIGGPLGNVCGGLAGLLFGEAAGNDSVAVAEDYAVENSHALQLAHCICNEWLLDFADFMPCLVANVVCLLQQL